MGNSNTLCSDAVYRIDDKEEIKQIEPWINKNDERKYLSPAYYEQERVCLENSGLKYEDFKIDNINIDDEGHYVRTFQVGMNTDPSLPAKEKLVMTHGYGGTIIMFWPVMKELSEHYHLIMFDILGMGSSSRPEFTFENAVDANDFFVGWMEKWRINIGILNEKFILCGHSFGGYISGHYTKRYPENIKKLLLLSPFGVPKRTFADHEFEEMYDAQEVPAGRKRPPKFAFKIVRQGWKRKWSPFGFLRKSPGCLTRMWLNRYAKNRINSDLPEQHRLDYKEFMKLTLLRPGSTEYALFVCFDPYFHAVLPLDDENCLRGLDVPISFVYGDRDWMTNVGKHDLLSSNPQQGIHSHYYVLEDSDHNLFFDNPQGLIKIIKEDLATVIGQQIDKIDHLKPLIVEEEEYKIQEVPSA